jgi:hypothetical protein
LNISGVIPFAVIPEKIKSKLDISDYKKFQYATKNKENCIYSVDGINCLSFLNEICHVLCFKLLAIQKKISYRFDWGSKSCKSPKMLAASCLTRR